MDGCMFFWCPRFWCNRRWLTQVITYSMWVPTSSKHCNVATEVRHKDLVNTAFSKNRLTESTTPVNQRRHWSPNWLHNKWKFQNPNVAWKCAPLCSTSCVPVNPQQRLKFITATRKKNGNIMWWNIASLSEKQEVEDLNMYTVTKCVWFSTTRNKSWLISSFIVKNMSFSTFSTSHHMSTDWRRERGFHNIQHKCFLPVTAGDEVHFWLPHTQCGTRMYPRRGCFTSCSPSVQKDRQSFSPFWC